MCKSLDRDNDSTFFGEYDISAGISIGMLPDTANYYALVIGVAASTWMPILQVYTKTEKLISSATISNSCGGDCGTPVGIV